MQHTESSIRVYFSKEYSQFKMLVGNRELNATKIKKIITDIENGTDVLRYCPIMVTEKNGRLEIIDGQHRFFVSKKIKSPVWYIIAQDMSLYDIAKMNSNTEKWKSKDFVNCYVQLGNTNYSKLQELMDKYPAPISSMILMLQRGAVTDGSGGSTKKGFERGEFIVNHLDFTVNLLEHCDRIISPNRFSRHFIMAVDKIMQAGKVSIDDIIAKINSAPEALEAHGSYKAYLTNMENIYNHKKQKRVVIF
jgi:hypothetical protein